MWAGDGCGTAVTRPSSSARLSTKRFPLASSHIFLFAVFVVAVLAAWPLLSGPGLLNTRGGGDSPFLLQRLQQLETGLRGGHFPVRWMPDANYGYGYPFFNFYAPLSIYVTAVFRFLGFSYVQSIQLAQLAGFVVAAWGAFALARRWFGSPWAGLLTAVAYTTAPFHMVNVYVRGDSLAEFWAMAFYPLVLLAADGVWSRSWRGMALLALAYAGLILSHNISALIFSPFLLLYLFLLFLQRSSSSSTPAVNRSQFTARSVAALVLAFALAAFFFVPALAEKGWAQLGPVTEGYFHFSNHFRSLDLVQKTAVFDYSVDEGQAFAMGLVQAITAVAGIAAILFFLLPRRKEAKAQKEGTLAFSRLLFILVTFAVATFMIMPWSRPLWEHVPLLAFTQFPWRFLSVQALAGALAAGALALLPGRRVIVPLAALALTAAALIGLRPDYLPLADADVTAEKLAQYEWFTGNIGSTVSAEYLYTAVQPRPFTSPWLNEGQRDRMQVLAGTAGVTLVERQAARQTWQVNTPSGAVLAFPTMYWPGWQAAVDGQATAVSPAAGSGLLQIDVPPGDHTITLHLGRTPVQAGAAWVSLTAVLLTVGLLWPRRWGQVGRGLALLAAGLVVLALAARLWPEKPLAADTLNWDFAQMAYLHHEPAGIPFTDGLTLASYSYSQEEITPGGNVAITLNWEEVGSAAGQPVSVALYSPAITRPSLLAEVEPPPIAAETQPLAATMQVVLPIPADAPAGLFMPRVLVAGQTAVTAAGAVRGDLFLRPLRVAGNLDEVAQLGRGALDVQVVDGAVRNDAPVLDLHLAWWTARPLSQNYNVSLRLTDGRGVWLQQLDTQPGFGFLPSSGWEAGQWTADWLALSLPDLEPEAGPYPLLVQLYDVAAPETAVLTRRLGALTGEAGQWVFAPVEPLFDLPPGMGGETAVFGDMVALAGYTVEQQDEALTLKLVWHARRDGEEDYTRFVHLVDPAGGHPLAQSDSFPVFNTYPTGQWTTGEVVTDVVVLDLAQVPPGEYQLLVGFYRKGEGGEVERVTAVGENGAPFPNDAVPLQEISRE
ncbi:MAG: hypothetical protein KC441_08970 [Anaerolineales bacterium]|nr:hypothetical protein [Anaerolineales bacterium]